MFSINYLSPEWQSHIQNERGKGYYKFLERKLRHELEFTNKAIYPSVENVFKALIPLKDLKVVILGQDPYINENQAMGLAFSVPKDSELPPSLNNIFKELKDDLGIDNQNGDLTSWSNQGVMLLNSVLTVEAGKSGSHANLGWETFTDSIIHHVNVSTKHVVFVLWGANAKAKKHLIDESKHFVITSAHPSPLSSHRGFFGSKPFSQINNKLIECGRNPIDWRT